MAQIFLSYAREDEERVKKLYQKLVSAGFKPWMDKKDILPGEIWKSRIPQAIRESDFFLACLSCNSVTKRGWIQREIKGALDIWQEKLDSDIYLIPARLEDCEVPERLGDFQWVDLFEEDGWTRLMKAIQEGLKRRAQASKPVIHESVSSSEHETRESHIEAQGRSSIVRDESSDSNSEGTSPDKQETMPVAFLKMECDKYNIVRRIKEPVTIIGRAKDCHLEIPDDYDNVERYHATIFYKEGIFTIADGCRDSPTRFGTFVNGNRLKPRTRIPLRNGDRIVLGGFRNKEVYERSRGACEILFEIGS
jgi:hypothetical protein